MYNHVQRMTRVLKPRGQYTRARRCVATFAANNIKPDYTHVPQTQINKKRIVSRASFTTTLSAPVPLSCLSSYIEHATVILIAFVLKRNNNIKY